MKAKHKARNKSDLYRIYDCYTENNTYHFPESLTALETDTCIIQLAVSQRQNNLYLLLTMR